MYRKLGRSGLVLYLQTFQYYKWNDPLSLQSGVNIIGVLPGQKWRTSGDKPVIVSSHWDITVSNTAGWTGLDLFVFRLVSRVNMGVVWLQY